MPMDLRTAERIAATVAAKPFPLRQAALTWARTKGRDRTATRELRARAGAVADAIHSDMAERDRRAAAEFASL